MIGTVSFTSTSVVGRRQCGVVAKRVPLAVRFRGPTPPFAGAEDRRAESSVDVGQKQSMEDTVLADVERLQRAQAAQRTRFQGADEARERREEEGEGLKGIVDKILIADFFFVVAALAGLAVSIGYNIVAEDDRLAMAWLGLWPWLFQPAIGVLMAGALASGGLGWLAEQKEKMTGGR